MARFSLLACAAPVLVLIGLTDTVAASETRCVRGDDAMRRVVVESPEASTDVPCEVVYWKDTEQPGVRSVLWSAQTDAGFCAQKAQELVGRLQSAGWSCTAAGEQPRSASRQAPPADGPESEVAAQRPQAPALPQAGSPPAAPSVREALAPSRAEPEAGDDTAEDAPAATGLDAIIEQNLARLNDGVDGKFAAEIADYGDLDGDGLDDGLVFFTYESQRLGKARFVAAYLFDGESYALAATKPLAGSDDDVHSAEIESIEDGVISLRLNILEPGDASCCPSGQRRQALVLRDGQLIEARSAAGVQGRS